MLFTIIYLIVLKGLLYHTESTLLTNAAIQQAPSLSPYSFKLLV